MSGQHVRIRTDNVQLRAFIDRKFYLSYL